ncbi:MAG: FKBP-type peptidyl-prolyl cis-trans isomerase [Parcubacteria group bacterium]|nr:FKBP-type peptidyl-prolyl cis-trans isomerase [Parcubacteria group bacterium]
MKNIIYSIIILGVIVSGCYFLYRLTQNDSFEGISSIEDQQELTLPGQTKEAEQTEQTAQQTQPNFDELTAQILKEGTGQIAENGNNVTVHYVGVLEDGTKFDSSLDRGQPFDFTLGAGQVISGWDLGVAGMKVGEIRRLYIPSEFGYGETGTPGGPIPPNANLIFDVELLGIN